MIMYWNAVGIIDGQTLEQRKRRIKQLFWPTMVGIWKSFPLIQVLTIKFLPPALWLPWFNLLGFIFGVSINTQAKLAAIKAGKKGGGDEESKAQ